MENGSSDASRQIFEEKIEGRYPNIKVVYVPQNRGYGYGIQQGMKAAEGDYMGWIHADLQLQAEELIPFFREIERHSPEEKLFLKGRRTNRSFYEKIFTFGQSAFSTCLFGRKLYDIGAIPVVFSRCLAEEIGIDNFPREFTMEIFTYEEAARLGYQIIRPKVKLLPREAGNSSWNRGLKSRIRLALSIMRGSVKIKHGERPD